MVKGKEVLLEYLFEVWAAGREHELVRLEGPIATGERHVGQRRRRVDSCEQLAEVLQVVVPLQVERLVARQPLHLHHHSLIKTQITPLHVRWISHRKPTLLRPLHKIIIITTYF